MIKQSWMIPLKDLARKNPFIAGLLIVVTVSFVFPELGAKEGPLKAGLVAKLGVMVIFLLQGLSLKSQELAKGFRDIRLHGFIQAWIFLLSPLILVPAGFLMKYRGLDGLANGYFYLALVPTTITSALTFTSAAGGNVTAAIFNTSFSNVWGVFWVPAGCLMIFSTGNGLQGDLVGSLFLKLAVLILLPLAAGQLLRPFLYRRDWFRKATPHFKTVNHAIILFIVFSAISQSVLSDTWGTLTPGSILLLLFITVLAVVLVHGANWITSGWVLNSMADRKAALFCGSQKTLAAGAPIAVAVFSNGNYLPGVDLGQLLLPLLCYHPIQLFLAAFLLPRLSR